MRKEKTNVSATEENKAIFRRYAEEVGNQQNFELERVMNSIRNALGMRETEMAREPRRPWNPHFYAVFAQVHNTL